MKKVLITGNSGYIGSHLSKLLSTDYELYGLDLNLPQVPVVEHLTNDVRKITSEMLLEFDTIVHLAALVKVNESEQSPIQYYTTNIAGTLNVLKNIRCNNFIFASTGAAEHCNSPYAVSKRAAEDCVREHCQTHNISYTSFRFYNVIGTAGFNPTNPDGLMYNLLKAQQTREFTIFGNDYNTLDGTCIRDYVHVMEICAAIQAAIENPSNTIECLGHGVGYTVRQIVDLFKSVNDAIITVKYAGRRHGDLETSVLATPSTYMKHLYSIDQLLKVTK